MRNPGKATGGSIAFNLRIEYESDLGTSSSLLHLTLLTGPLQLSSVEQVYLPPVRRAVRKAVNEDWTAAHDPDNKEELPAWRHAGAFLSDVYFGKLLFLTYRSRRLICTAVCFWTVFTSLGFQLFYWSVWKLGTSHEIV
jgi:hypothetical protein